MARESKRKRDEKRYGKPSGLAELLINGPHIEVPFEVSGDAKEWFYRRMELIRSAITIKTVEASNVFDSTRALEESGKRLAYDKSIKGVVPPFETCFVEFRVPDHFTPQIRHLGYAMYVFRPGDEPQIVYDALAQIPSPEIYARCRWIAVGIMAMGILHRPGSLAEGALIPGVETITFLDENGDSLQPPITSVPSSWGDNTDWVKYWSEISIFDCFLAFRFMNCKNVKLKEAEIDKQVERDRKKAGMPPSVRYHTIVVDPSKDEVRGPEYGGGGSPVALHVCRGHFKTWTTSYMGRPLDKPVTYWIPSHAKGSGDNGTVMSDYKVNAPK